MDTRVASVPRPTHVRQNYMPQLDALRAFAVFGVMAWHWLPDAIHRTYPIGVASVRAFFVLSGFLITGILLRSKRSIDLGNVSRTHEIRSFFARRFLRIFPLYYGCIVILALVNYPSARHLFVMNALYCSNFYFFAVGSWASELPHFWSLCVEEQFYLIWPWLILWLPSRALPRLIVAAIFLGPLSRLVLFTLTNNYVVASVLPISCMDALGAGAMLAWTSDTHFGSPRAHQLLVRVGLAIGVVAGLLTFEPYYRSGLNNVLVATVFDISAIGMSVWIIDRAAKGIGGPLGKLLTFPPLIYLGTISYGLYVFHPVVAAVVGKAFRVLSIPDSLLGTLTCRLLLTIAVSSASWFFYERPINRMKRFFPY